MFSTPDARCKGGGAFVRLHTKTMSKPNNYFRVQGTLDTFTFDESSPESVEAALAAARGLAHRRRTVRGAPAILVWRPTPAAKGVPAVGEPLDQHSIN